MGFNLTETNHSNFEQHYKITCDKDTTIRNFIDDIPNHIIENYNKGGKLYIDVAEYSLSAIIYPDGKVQNAFPNWIYDLKVGYATAVKIDYAGKLNYLIQI